MKQKEIVTYVDMDGVLADFERAFFDLTNMDTYEFMDYVNSANKANLITNWKYRGQQMFWDVIKNEPNFWENIPPCKNFIPFFNEIVHLSPSPPIVLTAVHPVFDTERSVEGKRKWIKNYFGSGVEVIIEMLDPDDHQISPKSKYVTGKESILIDDNINYINSWKDHGGTGIYISQFSKYETNVKKYKRVIKNYYEDFI